MTPARKRRLFWVLGILAGVGIAGALALSAFQKNVMFFFDPTQVASGEVKQGQRFRLGGMVTKGSFHREPGSLEVSFVVTDFKHDLPVKYTRVLPICSVKGRAWWRTASSARMACSSRMKCSPSTMRSTCRRKWRNR